MKKPIDIVNKTLSEYYQFKAILLLNPYDSMEYLTALTSN